MSQNQRCSNRPRPRNRKIYNGVEDEYEYEDEDEPKDELNPFFSSVLCFLTPET
jgi:hypothetical protein